MNGFLRHAKDLEVGNFIITIGERPFEIKEIDNSKDGILIFTLHDIRNATYIGTAKPNDIFEVHGFNTLGIKDYKP